MRAASYGGDEFSSPPAEAAAVAATAEAGVVLPPPVQLTFGGRSNGMTHGLADFVAQEEMDRYRGFWWSLDSSSIAFTEVWVGFLVWFDRRFCLFCCAVLLCLCF